MKIMYYVRGHGPYDSAITEALKTAMEDLGWTLSNDPSTDSDNVTIMHFSMEVSMKKNSTDVPH